jgi:hypothetical protein
MCATAYSSRTECVEDTVLEKIMGPETEEVTRNWRKQPSDAGKNESTYVTLVWKPEGKRLV